MNGQAKTNSTETEAPAVEVDGEVLLLKEGESVLERLERAGIDAPSGCRAGTCCKCMQRAEDPPSQSQRSLRPTLRAQGYFLSCQAYPKGLLRLTSERPPDFIKSSVASIEHPAEDVLRILLKPEEPFSFRPGQYLDVQHPSLATRSYSVASLPADGVLELHVRKVPDGLVSGWLHGLKVGNSVPVRGAFGQCFHVADDAEKKLLLVGAGTGLAPLLGIARDALDQGHTGPIHLVHGGLEPKRLYLREQLSQLEAKWPNLQIHHCVLRNSTDQEHESPLDQVAIRLAGSLSQARAFLCGDGGIVQILQRSLFLAGMPSGEILADPFLPAPT